MEREGPESVIRPFGKYSQIKAWALCATVVFNTHAPCTLAQEPEAISDTKTDADVETDADAEIDTEAEAAEEESDADSTTGSNVTLPVAGESEKDNPQFFFDARSTGFTKDGKQQIFEGDVIAIGPKSLVTADKVVIDEQNHYLVAEGHVIVLTQGQYITGEKVQIWGDTGNVKVTSALLVVNDSGETDRIANEVLGYTSSEIEFEAHRSQRRADLDKQKNDLRTQARQRSKEGLNVPETLIQNYARFLEQEDMISSQENPAFAQMAEIRRKTLRKRRDFWEQARISDRVKGAPTAAAYFRMTGDVLERRNGNDFQSTDGLWTPCHCGKDEQPAWALRSSESEIQPGGYATFTNTILEIKGLPVLYFPWLRIPIKDRRQSGLLTPTISSDSASGSTVSQPFFLDLGPNKDATIKADVFERRGTKIDAEYRYQAKQYSGFQINGELMQDRLWSSQRATRQDLKNLYLNGLDAALDPNQNADNTDLSNLLGRDYTRMRLRQRKYWQGSAYSKCVDATDPAGQQACRDRLTSDFRVPENERRGMFKWRGQQRLSDRMSLVSTGEIYSDRQYNTDLYLPESFQAGFDTGSAEKALQPARAQLHYDGRDYYLGVGSALGDNVLKNDRYEGFQTPMIIKAKTRWYRLGNTGAPIYGSINTDQYRIARNIGNPEDPVSNVPMLPNAWWRRATGSIVAPVSSNSAVTVDHFTDVEARSIAFDGPRDTGLTSSIQSLRTGLRFQLPIDGKTPLPNWLGGSHISGEDGTRNIQHLMNWSMTLTARPSVVRRGPYGEPTGALADLAGAKTFMATDIEGSDENIRPEDFMNPYQIVTFETSHRWKLFNEIWKRIEGAGPSDSGTKKNKGETNPKPLSYEERARRELLYSMDHPVKRASDMFSNDQTKWFINRYQLLETDYQEPLSLSANISYDRLKEVRRNQVDGKSESEREDHRRQYRPWSEPSGTISMHAGGWGLSDTSTYNIYDKIATRHALTLTPPGFWSSNLNLGYTLTQAPTKQSDGSFKFVQTRERTIQLVTSLTKPVFTTYTWGRKEVKEDANPPDYQQKIGLVYASPSQCWGVGFSREKGYQTLEDNATYVLQLNIIFMGQVRDLPDMSPQLTRGIEKS